MCGIAGWFRYGDTKVTRGELKGLLKNLAVRGTDATGVSWEDKKQFWSLKAPLEAKEFVKLPDLKQKVPSILNSRWALLHTRQATHGTAYNNLNNHPIQNEQGLIIHNGMVSVKAHLPSKGETDTEQLLLHVQKFGLEEGIKKMAGTMSFAYVDYSLPGFFLYSHCSSLVWGYDIERDMFVFCSTDPILAKSWTFERYLDKFPKLVMYEMPTDTVYHIDKEITKIVEVKPERSGTYYRGGQSYADWESYPGRTRKLVGRIPRSQKAQLHQVHHYYYAKG